MQNEYIFAGKAKWVSKNPTTFENGDVVWSMALYPDSATTRKAIQATGIQNRVALDKETDEAFFTLRSKDGEYAIIDTDGNPIDALVGNGSEVKVKLWVETFKRKDGTQGARSKLTEVMVTKLVPYEKPVEPTAKGAEQAELPA
jgi:hypothetical protein